MLWIACIFLFLPGSVLTRPRCGGVHTAARGIIQTPNFPGRFPVPIHCEWIIDAQHVATGNSTIVVYLTQLFVFEGLTFKEYQIYDQTYQLNGRELHAVTESNVTRVSYVQSKQDYLVITLKLETIESTHLRVLDHLLDVYGFNITYEITASPVRADRCTMIECGFTGICYDHYTRFSCSCFPGYEGPKCSDGPNSLCATRVCKNGGTCMHVGDIAVRCECRPGYTGEYCESRVSPPVKECSRCYVSCPFDGNVQNVCKCPEGSSPYNDSSMGFALEMKLANTPYVKTLHNKLYIESQVSKALRDAVPTLEDIHVAYIQPFPSHVEVTFHMSATRKDERRLKSVMSKWSDRGHVANLTLVTPATSQQNSLGLQPLTQQGISVHPSGLIHAGEDLVLSCRAQGVAPTFQWFKDGLFVNVTVPTSHKWSKLIEDADSGIRDQYTSQLGIKNASPLDQGAFTCQVVENGVQKCLTKRVEVRAPPRVWIEPMSLTVRKGENFTIKCFSVSSNTAFTTTTKSKYTYSWTKNKELLPIKTDNEHYEVLFPMGSILQVSSINKSTAFSCLVQDSAVWAEQSILVNVIDSELVKTCKGERHMKLLWPETAPGTESLQECPSGYSGIARRSCTLRDAGQPTWYLPDFSGCVVAYLRKLDQDFLELTLGYGNKDPITILEGYKSYLLENAELLPGEASHIISSVEAIIIFMNASLTLEIGNMVLEISDAVLIRRHSLVNQTQVILLQRLLKRQSVMFHTGFHRSLSTIDVSLPSPDKTGFHVPISAQSYPRWLSYKLHLALPQHYLVQESKSATLAVVVYRNLSAFLPQRSAIRLKDGIEMDYEIISNVATTGLMIGGIDIRGNVTGATFTMEFIHQAKNYTMEPWKILCGIADYASYGYSWDTQLCITRLLDGTKTRCLCPKTGTYAVLLTMKPSFTEEESVPVKQVIILIGCLICALLTTIAGLILALYLFYRRSCLVFLKAQCCASILGAILVLMYTLWNEVSADSYLTITTLLQTFFLIGMSSQLSNLLVIFSELVHLPRMRNIKQTVVLIITGAPMIAVFGNHMAHLTMNTRIESWWLMRGTLAFNIFITCCSIIIVLYFVLFYMVTNKIIRIKLKYEKSSEVLNIRLKLLKRSAAVFISITTFIFSSILYINFEENIFYHYLFSTSIVLMGIIIFFSYVLYSEASIKQVLITRLKDKNDEKQSPDTSKHLKFFTKQKAEVENESTPYFNVQETRFMYDPICKSEMSPQTFTTYASGKFIESQSSVGHSSQSSNLQMYEGSPKQFQQRECINSPDLLGSKKFVELDLVASSVQKQSDTSCFYEMNKVKLTIAQPPKITVTKADAATEAERQRPEGEEKISNVEIVPIVSIKEPENMDAVMDSITHDLDYLLNGNEFETETGVPAAACIGPIRRISRPPSLSVFEQIEEEPEEETNKVPEAITNVSRTSC